MEAVFPKPEKQPIVFVQDGKVYANSKDIAAFFEKEHKNVLRDVRRIEKSLELRGVDSRLNFEPFKINDLTGETTSHYHITRDGLALLAMGFTGEKAFDFKIRYIEVFNEMEARLRASAHINVRDPKQLNSIAVQLIEFNAELRDEVNTLKPKAQAYERIAVANNSLCLTDAAKTLQMGRSELIDYLSKNKWIYRRTPTQSWRGYEKKVNSGMLEHKVWMVERPNGCRGDAWTQVRITPKGLTKLAVLFNIDLRLTH